MERERGAGRRRSEGRGARGIGSGLLGVGWARPRPIPAGSCSTACVVSNSPADRIVPADQMRAGAGTAPSVRACAFAPVRMSGYSDGAFKEMQTFTPGLRSRPSLRKGAVVHAISSRPGAGAGRCGRAGRTPGPRPTVPHLRARQADEHQHLHELQLGPQLLGHPARATSSATATKNFQPPTTSSATTARAPTGTRQAAGEVANEIVNATNGGDDGGGNRCALP